jgi:hypothetical protein
MKLKSFTYVNLGDVDPLQLALLECIVQARSLTNRVYILVVYKNRYIYTSCRQVP